MKQSISYFIALIFFVISSCTKDGMDPLPEATQIGANSFGCKVNGKVWIPNGSHSLFVSIPALSAGMYQSYQGVKHFSIDARKDPSTLNTEEDSYDDLSIDIILPFSTGQAIIDKNCFSCELYCPLSSMRLKVQGIYNGACYMTDSLHPGRINFTRVDSVNRIYSGTFEFTAIDKRSGKTISATDGRFDVKW